MTRLEKLQDEIDKAKRRHAALEIKIKELEEQYRITENEQIVEIVKAADLTLEDLAKLLPALKSNNVPKKEETNV